MASGRVVGSSHGRPGLESKKEPPGRRSLSWVVRATLGHVGDRARFAARSPPRDDPQVSRRCLLTRL